MTETSASDLKKIIGLNLKKIRSDKNMSQSQLATACGWGQSRIGNYERGSNGIDMASAKVLAKALNVEVADILMPASVVGSRVANQLKQASSDAFTNESNAIDFMNKLQQKHLENINSESADETFTIRMNGSSMEGTNPQKFIPNGSTVVISKNIKDKNLNGLAVLVTIGTTQEPMIKELQIDGPNTYLIPWNQRYEAIKVDGPYEILGYVTKVIIDIHD